MASINPISSTTSLGEKRASHLLRRATFGPTKNDIDTFAGYTIDQALDVILALKNPPSPPIDTATGASWINPRPNDTNSEESDLMKYTLGWWLNLMRIDGASVIEKMAWFYHTHFTTMVSRVPESTAVYYQIALFRYYALGSFKALSKKMCYDNAMLYHLDGRLNEKGKPNENFAREFLELYTIGKGEQLGPQNYTNYTEQDVKEGARVLSGYNVDTSFENIDEDTGIAMGKISGGRDEIAYRHDSGTKVFSNIFNNASISPMETVDGNTTFEAVFQELDDYVDMIYAHEETARHICRKLYRFFCYYKITDEIENDIITPLAQTFRDNDYEIWPVLTQLFKSQHFYDEDNAIDTDDNIGAIIKSPLDLTIGALRFFDVSFPDETSALEDFYEVWWDIYRFMSEQGMNFYEPFEVAGYKAYHQNPVFNRNWISPNNLARRYQLSEKLLLGINNEDGDTLLRLNIYKYVINQGIDLEDENAIVQHFTDYLLPRAITQERFDYFIGALLDTETAWDRVIETDDVDIISYHLELLVAALIQSPEFQLF